jgi:ribonuclease HII
MAPVNRRGDPTLRIGIDENGLGPRLGPLVVTAVIARSFGFGADAHARVSGHQRAEQRARGALRTRLADSKKLVSHGDTALGEAWARAIAQRMAGRAERTGPGRSPGLPTTPEDLVRALSLDSPAALRRPCPGAHEAQCWNTEGEELVAEAKLVQTIEKDLAKLESQGVDVIRAACIITCARRLNEGVARGLSRFDVDLHCMERLALHVRECEGSDVVAICGKVGGFDRYPQAFGPLGGRLHTVLSEGRARSEYALAGLGRIAFVRDADDSHLLVSMASLVGKWVRDLLMARIVRHHRAALPDLPDASGYHDPVTTDFIERTRLVRRSRALPDDCFTRRALGAEAEPVRREPRSARNRSTSAATSAARTRPSRSSRPAGA